MNMKLKNIYSTICFITLNVYWLLMDNGDVSFLLNLLRY